MDQAPVRLALFGDEQESVAQRLELLLLDLWQAEELGQRHESLAADSECFNGLAGIFGGLCRLLSENLLNYLVKLLKDVKCEQVEVTQEGPGLLDLF